MGNLPFSASLFGTGVTKSEKGSEGKFITRKISKGITHYYAPFTQAANQTVCPAKDLSNSHSLGSSFLHSAPSAATDPSSSPLLSDTLPQTLLSSQNTHQTHSASSNRPILLFFSWLGAQPGTVAKYTEMYLERGMDVLLVQSSVFHFLWPSWGLDYGLEVLKVLEEPQFSGRPMLVYASSIGGYTFTQVITHIAQRPKEHADVAQRVTGHIYDSLVAGSLEHMAIGLGKTLLPSLEGLVKNMAMFYFWLFKTQTVDFYNSGIEVFNNSPITAPALFFFCENDALCDPYAVEKILDIWRRRGVTVQSRKWKKSIHAAHMRCHPEEYLSTLEQFLNSLPVSSLKANI
ncbi:uncharacterized protein LOC128353327 [Scomber scombrus]|uniref:Uncharacterized protein LOC128353327 n=1 Tax=Scomber scombrus TaxID=13677 RepID=A0AAV1NPW4_SCOSC